MFRRNRQLQRLLHATVRKQVPLLETLESRTLLSAAPATISFGPIPVMLPPVTMPPITIGQISPISPISPIAPISPIMPITPMSPPVIPSAAPTLTPGIPAAPMSPTNPAIPTQPITMSGSSGTSITPLVTHATSVESASAQITLVSTTGSQANPTFNYQITLTDTGTTNVGTFWFGWVPGDDFLPTAPLSTSNPSGWTNMLVGSNNAFDGTSIQWVAQSSSAALKSGQSLTFGFSSHDTLAQLAGASPAHPSFPAMTSFIYVGAPETDPGDQFTVTEASVPALTGTSTALMSSAPSVKAGTPVTFTATITPTTLGANSPSGTVIFKDNGNVIGNGTLQADGTATFTTSSLSDGAQNITAIYGGDTTYAASTSSPFTETILAPTATHLVFVQQPANAEAGHALNAITIDLDNAKGQIDLTNTSNITISLFNSNATLAGTLTVAAVNGVATFADLSLTKSGNYTFTAAAASFPSVKSKSFTISADAASAHLVLVDQPSATAPVGKPLAPTIVVEVEDQFENLVTSDHSKVTLSVAAGPDAGRTLGTATVSNSVATFKNLVISPAGDYTLQLADNSLAIATPVTFNETITQAATTIAAPSVKTSYTFGETISLAASLKSNVPNAIPFTGTATITDQHNNVLATATVSANGQLKFILTPGLAPAIYTATINYAGDANHTAVMSPTFQLDITQVPTTTTLKTSAATLTAGQSLTLTAIVSAKNITTPRTGTITFEDAGVPIGNMTLNNTSTAVLVIPAPTAGPHDYTAVYSGDVNFNTSTSFGRGVTVKPMPAAKANVSMDLISES